MALPNYQNSIVEDKKIIEYLLNLSHKIGASKANFFYKFGFTLDNIELFRNSILNHAVNREIETFKEDEYGKIYTLVCSFETPDFRNPCIKSVWIVNKGEECPRLVTAYPEKEVL